MSTYSKLAAGHRAIADRIARDAAQKKTAEAPGPSTTENKSRWAPTGGVWAVDAYERTPTTGPHGSNAKTGFRIFSGNSVANLTAGTTADVVTPVCELNAHLICRAVNNHQPLVELLTQLMEFWDHDTPVHPGAEIVAEARALLAKATAKPELYHQNEYP